MKLIRSTVPATHNRSSRLPMSGSAMGGSRRGPKCHEAVQGALSSLEPINSPVLTLSSYFC